MKRIGIEVNGVLRDTIEKFTQLYQKYLKMKEFFFLKNKIDHLKSFFCEKKNYININ